MDKTEMAAALVIGVLGFLSSGKSNVNTPTATTKSPTVAQANSDWIQITPDITALVSARSTGRTKDVTIRYASTPGQVLVSNELYDCNEQRHKLIVMQLFENDKLKQVQHEDFPYWEPNNEYENEVQRIVCAK